MKKIYIPLVSAILLISACQSTFRKEIQVVQKVQQTDPFKNTMVESQFFSIDANADNSLETQKGSILIIPAGAFIDGNGNTVEDSVEVEFAEATEFDEVILSNLMIQDSARVFESYGAFFFNATRQGKQLQINPENPVYIEVPAEKQVNLYAGSRDKLGNMEWKKAQNPVNYLILVPLELLDFYPEGFERAVEQGLPFNNHEVATKELLDSLYYSFATEVDDSGYYRGFDRLLFGNLTPTFIGFIPQLDQEVQVDTVSIMGECGINPASIKAIRDKKFQNTLISTREFEYRLQTIFATCNNKVLELYVHNLDKNLWEIDSMAAELLGETHDRYSKFKEYASYKQTTVKLSGRKAKMLAEHYAKSKQRIENELLSLKKKYIREQAKLEALAQKKREEYRELLTKRQAYRMKKFGFELTNAGWYNAAHEVKVQELETFELNITLTNGKQYDRVYAYVINPKIRSIFSYHSADKRTFNIVYSEDPDLLLWKNQEFKVLGVGYIKDSLGYQFKNCVQQPVIDVELSLEKSNPQAFRKDIREFTRGYRRENKIVVDLEYQAFFYREQQRKKRQIENYLFLSKLREKVFPCCGKITSWTDLKDKILIEESYVFY